MQQRISSLQKKIDALSNQNPPLSDKAQAALSTLAQQLAALKSQLEKGDGSAALDGNSLSMWLAQLDKLQTLLQQGDINAASWTGQLQAMVQHLTQTIQQTHLAEGRAGQSVANMRSSHLIGGRDVQQDGAIKEPSAANAQAMDSSKKDNHTVNNQGQFQNNPIVSGGGNTAAGISGHMQGLSGAIGSALATQTVNPASTLSPLSKGAPKTDLVMQLVDRPGDNAPGAFNLSASGFGAAANTNPIVALPGALALNQPRLAADLGQNIQFMVGKNILRATLDVNPAHLGPMKITIDQQNNQTNIQIMASHHLAKDMLDQNMPRLREWLQDVGLGNAQITVTSSGQDGSGNQGMYQGGQENFGEAAGGHGASTSDSLAQAKQPDLTHSGVSGNQVQAVNGRLRLDTFA
ncbi:flagellar hook-length control protein FliK [Halothiobacillus sp. 15-55-196]|uniref:flagellar hook-length control protein FliK n=1 Tax=Halothiobacillus sp. 15-55-196 TaxID=1970382 RepID=UPI0025C0F998|nr:flagellar hook-length control protein FliK [Halothiobacillus sp. 15-55-196]